MFGKNSEDNSTATKNEYDFTVLYLHAAMSMDDTEIVEMLLSKNVDVNAKYENDRIALISVALTSILKS